MKKLLVVMPVYISYDLHLEFTAKTISSVRSVDHTNHEYKICIVVNRCEKAFESGLAELSPDVMLRSPENGVAKAWNIGIRHGLENNYDQILVINNDIVFHQKAFDNISLFIEQHKDLVLWTMAEWKGKDGVETRIALGNNLKNIIPGDSYDEHPHMSAFAVTPQSIKELAVLESATQEPYPGLFDENFKPAYFEDGDMHQRIIFYGKHVGHTASALFYHYGSRTIKVDSDLNITNGMTYEKNRAYFKRKWGWDPHGVVVENDDKRRFMFKKPFNK